MPWKATQMIASRGSGEAEWLWDPGIDKELQAGGEVEQRGELRTKRALREIPEQRASSQASVIWVKL